jgi:murein L,D-transpeptidase YcbB/YkuD
MINPYLIGKNVYRAGSPAPTVGTVDPMGYVDREQRSRLAQQILNRQQQVNTAQQPGVPPTPISLPIFQDRNEVGNIAIPNVPPTTLKQDADYTTDIANAYTNWAQQAEALRQQRTSASQSYTQNISDLQRRAQTLPDEVRIALSGRGMGESSAFAQALADQQENLMKQAQGLTAARTNTETDYATQLAALNSVYGKNMEAATTALSQRLAREAGNLGLGKPADVNDVGDASTKAINDAINSILNPSKPAATAPKPVATAPKPAGVGSVPSRPTGIFRTGSTGNPVRSIQTMLNKYGAKLKVDGQFGSGTLAAVKAFQKKYGLKVDGIVGSNTLARLWK